MTTHPTDGPKLDRGLFIGNASVVVPVSITVSASSEAAAEHWAHSVDPVPAALVGAGGVGDHVVHGRLGPRARRSVVR
jgi:hypothetical protein